MVGSSQLGALLVQEAKVKVSTAATAAVANLAIVNLAESFLITEQRTG